MEEKFSSNRSGRYCSRPSQIVAVSRLRPHTHQHARSCDTLTADHGWLPVTVGSLAPLLESPWAIHTTCLVLTALNLVVRTWRTQVIFRGLSVPASFFDVAATNLGGDAAAALTPMRAGGIPAQVAILQRLGIRPQLSVPALLVESVLLYPVYAVMAVLLATVGGLEWFDVLSGATAGTGRFVWIGAALFIAGWLLLLLARRFAPSRTSGLQQSLREGVALTRSMRPAAIALTVPLTVADVLTRVALLPILAIAVQNAPPSDVLAMASFTMLYGQIFLPTPAGAGIVDLGILGGVAGDLGVGAGAILIGWRIWTAGVHVVLSGPAVWWRLTRVRQREAGALDAK